VLATVPIVAPGESLTESGAPVESYKATGRQEVARQSDVTRGSPAEQCPGCYPASRPTGASVRLGRHGLRTRWMLWPTGAGGTAAPLTVLCRRFRCMPCGAVVLVEPPGHAVAPVVLGLRHRPWHRPSSGSSGHRHRRSAGRSARSARSGSVRRRAG